MNKVIFISDVHLGSKGSNPKELYKLLNKEQPQKIFIVGDFIDYSFGSYDDMRKIIW
jgi:UDP-2,3-diacylglucosamine pyrophosphatase LpxH